MSKIFNRSKEQLLSYMQLISYLNYDPSTGYFTKVDNNKRIGFLNSDGYRVIQLRVGRKLYKYSEHRLAWYYMNCKWPDSGIDHSDMNKSNNSYQNLRPATQIENAYNQPKRRKNSSGYKGVYTDTGNTFYSKIKVNGKRLHLGSFPTAIEASNAYKAAALKYHGQFANV